MADPTDERLREIATSDPLALAICAQMGEPSWADVRAIAAELLAARNKIRADEEHLPTIGRLTEDLYRTEHDLDAARSEVERLRGLIREYVQATDGLAVEDSAEAQNRYERAEDALREARRG